MTNIIEDEVIKAVLQDGLSQVDENLVINDFETVFESENRILRVNFTAVNKETAESIEINQELG